MPALAIAGSAASTGALRHRPQRERGRRAACRQVHVPIVDSTVRRLLLLSSAIVFFDTLFFAALTPLLPHYAHTLGLGKTGAGVLAAAYPAGAFVGAIPSGIVAARVGSKPTVIVGLTVVAVCTVLFGVAEQAWQLDLARFLQGLASAFSWTGALAWLVAAAPPGGAAR